MVDQELPESLLTRDELAVQVCESAPDGLVIVDETGKILLVNHQMELMFGYDRAEVIGEHVEMLLPERVRTRHRAHRAAFRAAPRRRPMGEGMELAARRHDGSEFPSEVSLSPIQGPDDMLVIASIRDITNRRTLERARDRLALLEDRERIGRDLHDLVIQRLFAAGMGLEAVSGLAPPGHVAERISDTVRQLDETINEVRSAIFHLESGEATPLATRIKDTVVAHTGQLGFDPVLSLPGRLESISPQLIEQLLPVLNEALSNVARHAGANTVTVTIEVTAGELVLRVADDGVGMDPSAARGQGLDNLESRAAQLGGESCAAVRDDGGTVLTWRVPL